MISTSTFSALNIFKLKLERILAYARELRRLANSSANIS